LAQVQIWHPFAFVMKPFGHDAGLHPDGGQELPRIVAGSGVVVDPVVKPGASAFGVMTKIPLGPQTCA